MAESELGEELKQRILEARKTFGDAVDQATEATKAARKKLRELALADLLDESKIRDAGRVLGEAMAESTILQAKMSKQIREGLSPDQLQQLERAKEQIEARVLGGVGKMKERLQAQLAQAQKKGDSSH